MKRTLITTVLTVSLVTVFEFSTLPAAELDQAALGDATKSVDSGTDFTQLIARGRGGFRGGGGARRGGGGFRRSGGFRSGGFRSGGYRAGGARRTSSVRRGGAVRRTGGMRRSNGAHAQSRYTSNGRSSHASNARSNNRGGQRNNGASRNHTGNHRGNGGGSDGRGGAGGWDGAIVPVDVDPYVPDLVPVVPDVVPVVVDPQPVVITLMNPAETRTTLSYNLGGGQYVLEAGQSMGHGDETQVIAFDRGGSFGEARYTLEPGAYRFVATDHGWDLRTVTEEVATDTTVSNDTDLLTWLSGR